MGVGGSFAVGTLTRVAPGAASRLVHLTRVDSAAAIRASEALGLGRSTIYAGPESLASARGWSILARTGLRPGQATEVILLPSAANSSFVVVQPMGVFSAWQRLNETVFSAGTGMFNLSTGAFTRTGIAANQLVIYSTDAAAMAMARAAPGRDGHRSSPMKPERIVLLLAWLLLAAGFLAWVAGGVHLMRSLGIWLWVGAAGMLGLPLLIWLVEVIFRGVRR